MAKTITGNWTLPNGSAVANGTLSLLLKDISTVVATGVPVANTNTSISLDINGSVLASTTILASDEIQANPPIAGRNTTYQLSIQESGGGTIFGPQQFYIAGPSPINLNALAPVEVGGPIVFATAVLTNPSAAQTISGFALSVINGQTITGGLTLDSATASGVVLSQFALPNQGTAFSVSNVSLAAAWGTTASVTGASGTAQRMAFTINSSGSGQANPAALTVTWATAFPVTPFVIAKQVGGTGTLTTLSGENGASTTVVTLSFQGLPVAGSTYVVNILAL